MVTRISKNRIHTDTSVALQGPVNYAAATGTDTYIADPSPAFTAYVTGAHYFISFTNANTSTTPTLNLNGLGAKTIVKEGTTALAAGNIPAGHKGILMYDGTYMVLLNPKVISVDTNDMVLLQTTTAANDASITIGSAALFTSTYKRYVIVGSNIRPDTDSVEGMTRVSIASSVKTDATYQYARLANSSDSGAFSGLNSQTATAFANMWAQSGGNASGENCGFTMAVDSPSDTNNYKILHFTAGSIALSGQIGNYYGVGYYGGSLGALDGVQFYYSSGNIAAGTFKLYGLK